MILRTKLLASLLKIWLVCSVDVHFTGIGQSLDIILIIFIRIDKKSAALVRSWHI